MCVVSGPLPALVAATSLPCALLPRPLPYPSRRVVNRVRAARANTRAYRALSVCLSGWLTVRDPSPLPPPPRPSLSLFLCACVCECRGVFIRLRTCAHENTGRARTPVCIHVTVVDHAVNCVIRRDKQVQEVVAPCIRALGNARHKRPHLVARLCADGSARVATGRTGLLSPSKPYADPDRGPRARIVRARNARAAVARLIRARRPTDRECARGGRRLLSARPRRGPEIGGGRN